MKLNRKSQCIISYRESGAFSTDLVSPITGKHMSVLMLFVPMLLFSGCGVQNVNPYYQPSGNIISQDVNDILVEVQVDDLRSMNERIFLRYNLLGGHTDYIEQKLTSYVRMRTSSREIVEKALKRGLYDAGYTVSQEASVVFKVTLWKFLAVSPNTWDSKPDIVTGEIELWLEVNRAGRNFLRKHITEHSQQPFNGLHQYRVPQEVLSLCLTKSIEMIVSDVEVAQAVKEARSTVVSEQIGEKRTVTEHDPGEQEENERTRERPEEIAEIEKEKVPDQAIVSQGTGFLFAESGLVATNSHVVSARSDITVFFPEAGIRFEAKIELKDISNDLAILKMKHFTYSDIFRQEIPFGIRKSNNARLGEKVFTLGFPLGELLGKSPKFSDGTIASLSGLLGSANLFQINNPVQPGNSGGPLFDEDGNVIGIVVASLDAKFFYENLDVIPQNVNFAVKSDYLINLVSLLPESDAILSHKGSLKDWPQTEQVNALIPYIVTIDAR